MKVLYGLLTFVVILFLSVIALLVYAILSVFPSVSSDLLAIFGAYLLLRIAILLVLVGGVIWLLYWAISGSSVATEVYQTASPEDKEKLKKSFCDGISILKYIVETYREFRKNKKK